MLNNGVSALVLLAFAAPCCQTSERKLPEMSTMQNAQPPGTLSATAQDCDLRVAIQASPTSLLLGYEFRNRSNRTAFLFNVVHKTGPSGGPEPDPNLVYVEPSGGSIILGKKIIPAPRGMRVEKPDVPYVTRVEPGQAVVEKLDLMLPLRIFTPYDQPAPSALAEAAVYFELGFFLAPDPSVAEAAGGYLIVDPFPAEKQIILRAGPLGRFPVQPAQK
ncbi:MAG: hypothetical protein C0504_13470 [Candidatus Solibacter sp.]|nr:hypothetical protein [Candidatus Solibacter sp.]